MKIASYEFKCNIQIKFEICLARLVCFYVQ